MSLFHVFVGLVLIGVILWLASSYRGKEDEEDSRREVN